MSYLALKLTHYGPPESSLKLVECEDENPGLEEAVIHVDAVGMHIADSLTARGTEKLKEAPCIPGFEGVLNDLDNLYLVSPNIGCPKAYNCFLS